MLTEFASAESVVGIKQSSRAVTDGNALKAYAAKDADPGIVDPFSSLCEKHGVELIYVSPSKSLTTARH